MFSQMSTLLGWSNTHKLLKISIFSGYENHIFPKNHPFFSWVHGESQAQNPLPRRTHAFPFLLLSSSLFCGWDGWDPVGIRLGSKRHGFPRAEWFMENPQSKCHGFRRLPSPPVLEEWRDIQIQHVRSGRCLKSDSGWLRTVSPAWGVGKVGARSGMAQQQKWPTPVESLRFSSAKALNSDLSEICEISVPAGSLNRESSKAVSGLVDVYYFCFPCHSVAKHLPPSDDWQLRLFANIFLTPILVTSIFTQPALCPGPSPGVCQLDGATVCLRHAMYGMILIDFSWGSRSTQTPYSFKSITLN